MYSYTTLSIWRILHHHWSRLYAAPHIHIRGVFCNNVHHIHDYNVLALDIIYHLHIALNSYKPLVY